MMPAPMRSRKLSLATGLTYNVAEWDAHPGELTFVLVHGFGDMAVGKWARVAERLAPPGAAPTSPTTATSSSPTPATPSRATSRRGSPR